MSKIVDHEDWSSADLIEHVKETISMWDLLDAMDIDYPRVQSDRGVKISTRDEAVPSCHIYPDHWFDFGTGEGGDVINFFIKFGGKPGLRPRSACLLLLGGEIGSGLVASSGGRGSPGDLAHRFFDGTVSAGYAAETDTWFGESFLATQWAPLTAETLDWAQIRATKYSAYIPHYDWTGAIEGRYSDGERVPLFGIKNRGIHGRTICAVKGSTFTTQFWCPMLAQVATSTWKSNPTRAAEWWRQRRDDVQHVIICEGESDTMAVHQHIHRGHPAGVSYRTIVVGLPAGAGVWRPEWLEPFGRVKLHAIPDADSAGIQFREKLLATHPDTTIWAAVEDARADLVSWRRLKDRGVRIRPDFWPAAIDHAIVL